MIKLDLATPYGTIPVLAIDGVNMLGVTTSIMRYFAEKHGNLLQIILFNINSTLHKLKCTLLWWSKHFNLLQTEPGKKFRNWTRLIWKGMAEDSDVSVMVRVKVWLDIYKLLYSTIPTFNPKKNVGKMGRWRVSSFSDAKYSDS